ncbi:two pore domain potassium channel family protein [Komarekiella sp. 'clone 1']|uniref:Two pore domain potassium channel family protein n=1 Tax=Komarekiella delphini-convector SJRDD-AB1 TaxID=2593771 RepID=A0AA40SVD2_9NOST|nr:potassium channel family protein [Komarekiella delphini-convector]MBD6615610.1 two pore domain potassium channel family protein [Komarekiella delphini-convector SJRDD-AB1]
MRLLVQIIGAGIVILSLVDIYLTVLFPRLGSSLLSLPLGKGMWRLFRLIARIVPFKDDKLLSHNGPTLMIATVVVWVCLLICGFALIVWTELGSAIQSSSGWTETNFITALYYSGFSLTTLGTGDLTPNTDFHRLLMILEAAIGFSIFTLTITYLLSIYSALIRRNTFALSLHHRSAGTADAAEILARLGASGELSGVQQDISNMARDLINLLESQQSYPALLYFRFQETYYALPRILLLAMDTATLMKTALNAQKYRSIVHSTALAELWGGSQQLLIELSSFLVPKSRSKINESLEQVWRKRYYQAVKKFRDEGIETVTDLEAGASLYISLRRKWNPGLVGLTNYMGYKWSEIAPHEI